MLESNFKKALKEKIKNRFPGCIILNNDPSCIQGIPDLLILFKKHWAALEGKKDKDANHRPNQDYYVEKMNEMSFSSFVFPENEEEVLNAMEKFFKEDS